MPTLAAVLLGGICGWITSAEFDRRPDISGRISGAVGLAVWLAVFVVVRTVLKRLRPTK